jgi:hypothetical protein
MKVLQVPEEAQRRLQRLEPLRSGRHPRDRHQVEQERIFIYLILIKLNSTEF